MNGFLVGATSTGGDKRIQESTWSSLGSAGARRVLNGFNTFGAKIPGTEAGSTENLTAFSYDQGAVERKESRASVVQNLLRKRAEEDLVVGHRNDAQQNLVRKRRAQKQLEDILPKKFESRVPMICEIISKYPTTKAQRMVAFSKTRIESASGPDWLFELSDESVSGDLFIELMRNCDAFFSRVSLLTRGDESVIRAVRQGDQQAVSRFLDETDYDLVVIPTATFSANPNVDKVGESIIGLAIEIAGKESAQKIKIDK